MKVKVLLFGELSDLAGSVELTLENVESTFAAHEVLLMKFPSFKTKKYAIAVNKQLIRETVILADGDILALLPPFSGG